MAGIGFFLELGSFRTCTVMWFLPIWHSRHCHACKLSAIQLCLFNTMPDAQPQQHHTQVNLLSAHTDTYIPMLPSLSDRSVSRRTWAQLYSRGQKWPEQSMSFIDSDAIRACSSPPHTPVHGAVAPQPSLAHCTLHSRHIALYRFQQSETLSQPTQ